MLHAYPRDFRARHGVEMRQSFQDEMRETLSTASTTALLRFLIRMARDFPVSVVRERINSPSITGTCCLVGAIAVGLYAAYVDHHNRTEVYPTLFVVLVGSFILGMIRPAGAWRWAVIVGLGVPFAGPPLTLTTRVASPGAWAILGVVLIPGLIGVYTGSTLRRAAGAMHSAK
jgi:hypothetical protein